MIKPDKIIRSKRKTLAVAIDHFGRVTVRAPLGCDEKRIFAFLQEKEGWILRKKAQMEGAGMRLPPENLQGYSFLLLGKKCTVALTDASKITFDKSAYTIYLPKQNSRNKMVKWLKENAKRIFTQVAILQAQKMGVQPKSIGITSAKTRWGSCSGKNDLHFSFRLVYADSQLIEYVVTHELAHIKHKNHSRAFWREVEKYIPDWRERRKRLKTLGVYMEVF